MSATLDRNGCEVETSPDGRYIRFASKLGSGAYKNVFLAYDTDTGTEVAWNTVDMKRVPKIERKRLKGETEMLKSLKHPHIINFFSVWENKEEDQICFTTEIVTSGTLKEYINRVFSSGIKLKIIKKWCRQILEGLKYLHSHQPPIIHRDIKCDNIFINGNLGDIIIGDLGLSTHKTKSHAESVLGTPEFMAPELYDEHYTEKVDIWAFGMAVLEMATNQYPYEECENPAQIYRRVSQHLPPMILSRILDKRLRQFIELCFLPPDKRLCAKDLLDHPFLNPRCLDVRDQNTVLLAPEEKVVKPAPVGMETIKEESSEESDSETPVRREPAPHPFQKEKNAKTVEATLHKKGVEKNADSSEVIVCFDKEGLLTLALRLVLGGNKKEIKFPFDRTKDSAEQVALEMIESLKLEASRKDDIASSIDACLIKYSEQKGNEKLSEAPEASILSEKDGILMISLRVQCNGVWKEIKFPFEPLKDTSKLIAIEIVENLKLDSSMKLEIASSIDTAFSKYQETKKNENTSEGMNVSLASVEKDGSLNLSLRLTVNGARKEIFFPFHREKESALHVAGEMVETLTLHASLKHEIAASIESCLSKIAADAINSDSKVENNELLDSTEGSTSSTTTVVSMSAAIDPAISPVNGSLKLPISSEVSSPVNVIKPAQMSDSSNADYASSLKLGSIGLPSKIATAEEVGSPLSTTASDLPEVIQGEAPIFKTGVSNPPTMTTADLQKAYHALTHSNGTTAYSSTLRQQMGNAIGISVANRSAGVKSVDFGLSSPPGALNSVKSQHGGTLHTFPEFSTSMESPAMSTGRLPPVFPVKSAASQAQSSFKLVNLMRPQLGRTQSHPNLTSNPFDELDRALTSKNPSPTASMMNTPLATSYTKFDGSNMPFSAHASLPHGSKIDAAYFASLTNPNLSLNQAKFEQGLHSASTQSLFHSQNFFSLASSAPQVNREPSPPTPKGSVTTPANAVGHATVNLSGMLSGQELPKDPHALKLELLKRYKDTPIEDLMRRITKYYGEIPAHVGTDRTSLISFLFLCVTSQNHSKSVAPVVASHQALNNVPKSNRHLSVSIPSSSPNATPAHTPAQGAAVQHDSHGLPNPSPVGIIPMHAPIPNLTSSRVQKAMDPFGYEVDVVVTSKSTSHRHESNENFVVPKTFGHHVDHVAKSNSLAEFYSFNPFALLAEDEGSYHHNRNLTFSSVPTDGLPSTKNIRELEDSCHKLDRLLPPETLSTDEKEQLERCSLINKRVEHVRELLKNFELQNELNVKQKVASHHHLIDSLQAGSGDGNPGEMEGLLSSVMNELVALGVNSAPLPSPSLNPYPSTSSQKTGVQIAPFLRNRNSNAFDRSYEQHSSFDSSNDFHYDAEYGSSPPLLKHSLSAVGIPIAPSAIRGSGSNQAIGITPWSSAK